MLANNNVSDWQVTENTLVNDIPIVGTFYDVEPLPFALPY